MSANADTGNRKGGLVGVEAENAVIALLMHLLWTCLYTEVLG